MQAILKNAKQKNTYKNIFVFLPSFFYSLAQIAQGLLFHPYQTMQSLVREKVFLWMTFLPMIFLVLLTLFWRYAIYAFLQTFAEPIFDQSLLVVVVKFLANWLVFFCFYWQMILAYLLFRFRGAWRAWV